MEIRSLLFGCCVSLLLLATSGLAQLKPAQATLFKDVMLIDGNGGKPQQHMDMLVRGDSIAAIGKDLAGSGAEVIHLQGKYLMPALISAHVHVGALSGTTVTPGNYTRENILRQLQQYTSYGVGNILVMGTDRPVLFSSGLRDSSLQGLLPGARLHSAGYGFGVPQGGPMGTAMDLIFRPASVLQVAGEMDSLARVRPEVVKIWVDDFGGKLPKMDAAIYGTIIREAHQRRLRVAAHVYYLADARQLVADGIDIIAHSIRDKEIDQALLEAMKAKGVVYIPTLSLDEFAYIYARRPDWIDEPFFKASLEPGVYEMITSATYQENLKNSPDYQKNVAALEIALKNLKKIAGAGILVALGTDSGATPLRAQGFSEHLEMELMVQAGLTPLQAITIATRNAAAVLHISKQYGTLQKGKAADFIVLDGNPATDITNTRRIVAVYKAGKAVSHVPAAK